MAIKLNKVGHVATITLDRPEKLNALDLAHLRDLREAIVKFDGDPDVRVLILASSSDRAFSTGADIGGLQINTGVAEAFALGLDDAAEAGLYVRMIDLSDLRRRKPLIAAIRGYCLGGGLELALQADMIVASNTAQFGLPEANTGSLPGAGGVGAIIRALPRNVASHLLFTCERLPADQALNYGLVSAVYSDPEFEASVGELANKIASKGPLATQMIKMLLDHSDGLSPSQWMQMSELAWGHLRDTDDREEGRLAFSEKRPPQFKGK